MRPIGRLSDFCSPLGLLTPASVTGSYRDGLALTLIIRYYTVHTNVMELPVAKDKIRFAITSADLETAYSCDCQKWIRHLAANGLKTDDLHRMIRGKFPAGRLFVLDMLEFLRKTDPHLDRFLAGRGGLHQDDHLSIEFASVGKLLNGEFPELLA